MGSWQDVSRWREQRSGYMNSIQWTTNGDPHFVVSPRLKGRIEKLAVLPNLRVSWRPGTTASSGSPEYNVYKLLELEKTDDYNGYEIWKDSSGWLRDTSGINNEVKSLLGS